MTSAPEIRTLTAQPALAKHVVTDVAGLPAAIDSVFPTLFEALKKQA
jgi:hypothetical protein